MLQPERLVATNDESKYVRVYICLYNDRSNMNFLGKLCQGAK